MDMKIRLIDHGIKDKSVDIPAQKHFDDAGADVRLLDKVVLPPNSVTKVPLGFGVEIPNGLMGLIFPRSGLNSKGITIYYSPIDPGYRGELCAIVYNSTASEVVLDKGDRIGQMVIVPFIQADYVWDLESTRGASGFGSTGLN